MVVKHCGRYYKFRECDTKNLTQQEAQELADKNGKMQYEPHATWFHVKGIGFGWEVKMDGSSFEIEPLD